MLKAALYRSNAARLRTAETARSDFAVLTHIGRRSGRTYQTPLGAHTFGDGVILPLAYGSQTDWYRNVMAAEECTLTGKDAPTPWSGPRSSPVQK
jgi:deazaflavin-dependent oxidoreductase (nitroreductase family)